MRKRITRNSRLTVVALCALLVAAFAGTALAADATAEPGDGAAQLITLEQAYAIATEHSPKIRTARLELEDARIAFEQLRSQSLIRPDPIGLLQAETALELAERNLAVVQEAVRLEVAENFLGVLRLENLMDVVKGSITLAERQLDIAENRFAVGSAARVEIIRSANQLSNARANLLEMEGNRELAVMAFRMSLGLPLSQAVEPPLDACAPLEVDVELESDLAFALENRLEILRAASGAELAQKQVELASNDYTPALALQRARIGLERARDGLKQAKDGIELEIRQIYHSIQNSQRRLEVLEATVAEAEETLAITEEMYAAGVSTDVEVLGAQTTLTQSQTDYVNTLFDLRTAQVRYLHATAQVLADQGGETQ